MTKDMITMSILIFPRYIHQCTLFAYCTITPDLLRLFNMRCVSSAVQDCAEEKCVCVVETG